MVKMLKLNNLSPALRQFVIVQIANSTVVLLGMNAAWASPMMIKLKAEDQTILSRPLTENEEAWIVSINQLVGLSGLFFGGFFMNYFGRKSTMMVTFAPRFVAWFLTIFASEVWMLLLARSIGGIGDMLSLSAISTYISEVAGKEIRGASGTITQINSATGMLIMLGVGPFLSYTTMHIIVTTMVAIIFIPLLFLPETPYYLYLKGDLNKSMEVLTFLHGTEEKAREELEGFKKAKDSDSEEDIKTLLKDRIVIKSFVIVIVIAIGSQVIGYNAVNFYLQSIFESTQTSVSSEISSLIIGVIQLGACLLPLFLSDRFGRKPILCTTLVGMAVGMGALASFYTVTENGTEIKGFLNYLPLISVALVIIGFNAGMGSIMWILMGELMDGPLRSYGVSLGVLITGFFSFLLTRFFIAITVAIGPAGTYWVFAVGCILLCLFIGFVIPETKGKTFAEIQYALGRKDLSNPKEKNDA